MVITDIQSRELLQQLGPPLGRRKRPGAGDYEGMLSKPAGQLSSSAECTTAELDARQAGYRKGVELRNQAGNRPL